MALFCLENNIVIKTSPLTPLFLFNCCSAGPTQAAVLVLAELAQHQTAAGRPFGAAHSLDAAAALRAGHVGPVSAAAAAAHHEAAASLALSQSRLDDFCREALLFLTFRPLASLPAPAQRALAAEVAAAAAAADSVLALGELAQHPLVAVLDADAALAPLAALVRALDGGDLAALAAAEPAAARAAAAAAEAPLRARTAALLTASAAPGGSAALLAKARLLALGVRVFEAGAEARAVPLATVAAWCGVSAEEAEEVVVAAIARGVVRGVIDGVEGSVRFTWTAPRVLAPAQLGALRERVGLWRDTAAKAVGFVTEHSVELMASTL